MSHALRSLALLALALAAACGEEGTPTGEVRPEAARRADEFRSEELRSVLDAAEHAIQTRGFAPDGEEWRGFLVDQGSEVTEAPMHGGSCYAVVAAGSSALRELDLRVFDSDGSEVAYDSQQGAGAALVYCPPHTGTYYVAALATAGTGLFAVRRYTGPTGLDVRLDDLFQRATPREEPGAERP